MDQKTDRIKLALLMGWTECREVLGSKGASGLAPNHFHNRTKLPDPFTDANDDYAVLEWMRIKRDSLLAADTDVWYKFMSAIHETAFCTSLYQIGDYARAAIAVIE